MDKFIKQTYHSCNEYKIQETIEQVTKSSTDQSYSKVLQIVKTNKEDSVYQWFLIVVDHYDRHNTEVKND